MELLLPPPERATLRGALTRYLASGTGPLAKRQLETRGLRSDGTELPVELSVARVEGDRRLLLTGFLRDTTERRALEGQLRQSQKLEAIGRLASEVAHDFNNILMSIMGSADLLLLQLEEDSGAKGEATEIKESVRRGAGLTRQLLALSRRQPTSPRVLELQDVVGGMETMLRRLIGPEIDFQIACNPAGAVVADPAQLEQVILNLVINARDAMPDGGRLDLTLDEIDLDETAAVPLVEGNAGRYVRMSITDTGTGIDEATRARLFEPFFTTKDGKGTGLGLSIVYGIVRQSEGYITVASEPGHGATFSIYLPRAMPLESVVS